MCSSGNAFLVLDISFGQQQFGHEPYQLGLGNKWIL